MKAVVQRVKEAACRINEEDVSRIGNGLLIFVGIEIDDDEEDAKKLAYRCANLRIFEDKEGKMNLSVKEVIGEVLVISQFTLCADCKKGLRPSFDRAYPGEGAIILYQSFIRYLSIQGVTVKEGIFGSKMSISLVNEGPATFILST